MVTPVVLSKTGGCRWTPTPPTAPLASASQRVLPGLLAVADGDYLGLFDITTAFEHRRKGYGLELTSALLAWGKSMAARYAYLQVMTNNYPALNLYGRLGFHDIYDYWYRVAPANMEDL